MAFTGIGAGTAINPFQITTVSEFREMNSYGSVVWFKLMNDLDFGATDTADSAILINAFTSHLDGNNKQLSGLATGGGYKGFTLNNGSSVKDITFRVSNTLGGLAYLFGDDTATLATVSLTGIKIITSGSGYLTNFSKNRFGATCTLNTIIIEGNITDMVFSNRIDGLLSNLKVLRIGTFVSTSSLALISNLAGELKYSQHIVLGSITNNLTSTSPNGFICQTLGSAGKITECFVDLTGTVVYSSSGEGTSHVFAASSSAYASNTSEVKDCYFNGSFSVNGGEKTTEPGSGKSGFIITANFAVNINRCVASANIDSPLNNNRPLFSEESAETYTNNCFYKSSALTSIIPLDVASRQTGLTDEQFINSASFTGFDFVNVWEMAVTGPVLINNPRYAFEADKAVNIDLVVWQSGSSFVVELTPENTTDYGIEIYENDILIDTQTNQTTNIVTVDEVDSVYAIKSFYVVGGVTNYSGEYSYNHYVYEIAFSTAELLETTDVTLTTANYVHGSLIYDGFVYGVTRNISVPTDHGKIVKAPITDISAFETIDIKATATIDPYTSEMYSKGMEQIVKCGSFLYFLFNVAADGGKYYLCQYNPAISDYKVFQLPPAMIVGSAPIFTDGTNLYLSTLFDVSKILSSKFEAEFPKYNTYEVFPEVDLIYDSSSQGGHILGGYSTYMKGQVHSAINDTEFIYLAYTTGGAGESPSGYSIDYDVATCELHKVRISDMTAVGWIKIPKSTDDCTQNSTHLFYGIELQANSHVNSYGRGWGNYAVRKSDLNITALPRLSTLDNPPTTQSYGVSMFDNYLLDIKTNRVIYVIDTTNVDNWAITEPIGKRLLAKYQTVILMNELLMATDGTFYGFGWSAPSQLMKLQLQLLNYHLRIKVAIGNKVTYSEDNQVAVLKTIP